MRLYQVVLPVLRWLIPLVIAAVMLMYGSDTLNRRGLIEDDDRLLWAADVLAIGYYLAMVPAVLLMLFVLFVCVTTGGFYLWHWVIVPLRSRSR